MTPPQPTPGGTGRLDSGESAAARAPRPADGHATTVGPPCRPTRHRPRMGRGARRRHHPHPGVDLPSLPPPRPAAGLLTDSSPSRRSSCRRPPPRNRPRSQSGRHRSPSHGRRRRRRRWPARREGPALGRCPRRVQAEANAIASWLPEPPTDSPRLTPAPARYSWPSRTATATTSRPGSATSRTLSWLRRSLTPGRVGRGVGRPRVPGEAPLPPGEASAELLVVSSLPIADAEDRSSPW